MAKENEVMETHDIAVIMSGEHFTINVSEKEFDLTDGWFKDNSCFQILHLNDVELDEDEESRYGQIVNAGRGGSDGSDDSEGSISAEREEVMPQIQQGEDVASLATMGLEKDCEYDVYLDSGVPAYVCELTINGKFDPKKFVVTVGKLYIPDDENADEDGHINVIRSVKYDGEELNFWCSEWVGMPDNGWDIEDEWHYVVNKGKATEVDS